MQRNRLAAETSPYLRQHAENPVDWHPWGEEALALARRENRPILLSIGYSACHWCHVMAHESFEDPATAEVMNRCFVNVKVDREERPDLDKIYQAAQQMITQRAGGWPLTMFLSPEDQRPFFGGTYFPNEPRHGMPAFTEILQRVAQYYHDHSEEIRRQGAQLMAAFEQLMLPQAPRGDLALDDTPIGLARRELSGPSIRASEVSGRRQIPASRQHRTLFARLAGILGSNAHRSRNPRRGPGDAADGDPDAAPHGRRRHLRPARRWFRALLRR